MLIRGTYTVLLVFNHMEDNVRIYKRTNVYESGPYYSAGYCDLWSSFTIYFIVLFSTTETVGFGQHQWSDTFLYAGDKCTGYSAGSSVCRSISKPTWYVITLVWLLLFCLYYQGYSYAKMVVCQTIAILSLITCTLLWFSSDDSYSNTFIQISKHRRQLAIKEGWMVVIFRLW